MSPSERRRADESELHKKGYKTMAMNSSEPEPCKPLVADGDSRPQPFARCILRMHSSIFLWDYGFSRLMIFTHISSYDTI